MVAHSPLPRPPDSPAPLVVAFSGGLDSSVLLHWLAASPGIRAGGLRAIHVHHGLQASADAWAQHCQQICDALGIALHVARVTVNDDGDGPEAAARRARHQAFAAQLQPGEWLALGHHRDDQSETFLLRALRGSGSDGLAAMRPLTALDGHTVWRPLLDHPRQHLQDYALQAGLQWIEDPTNSEDHFDRNFLRQHVLPLLRQRWPQASATLALSAQRCAEDSDLLGGHDHALLAQLGADSDHLSIPELLALSAPQRARILRRWLRRHRAPALPGHLHAVLDNEILQSPTDRQSRLCWARHWILQRWRDRLYLRRPLPSPDAHWQACWDGRSPLLLPDGSFWRLSGGHGFSHPLTVRLRQGGERLRLPGRNHHTPLKDCLQQAGIPPWLRSHLPLLWDGDCLLAAGDSIRSVAFDTPLIVEGATLQRHCTAVD